MSSDGAYVYMLEKYTKQVARLQEQVNRLQMEREERLRTTRTCGHDRPTALRLNPATGGLLILCADDADSHDAGIAFPVYQLEDIDS